MKFDAIVGNPPYQSSGGSGGTNDAPVYQHFAMTAEALAPSYLSLIIPSRWFAGGRENLLGGFRKEMLSATTISYMKVFSDSHDVFPVVEIKGGLCYYLMDKDHNGSCKYTLIQSGEAVTMERDLGEFDVLIQHPQLAVIVRKVMQKHGTGDVVASIISADTPFGIPTNPEGSKKNPISVNEKATAKHNTKLYYISNSKRVTGYVSRSAIQKNADSIDSVKVLIPKGYGAGETFPHQILGIPILAEKNSVCSQSYLYASFENSSLAQNFISYLKTKFFRAMVLAIKISQDAMNRTYRFVPMQDFSKPWTDKELYEKYDLTEEEIDFIEKTIKPMPLENETQTSAAVTMIPAGGWVFYIGEDAASLGSKCGKWMYFFNDRAFAEKICRQAVEQGVVVESKHSDADDGVCCFYINGDEIGAHQRLLQFFLENDLIRKKKDGGLYNISFKFDTQTRAGEYGEEFESNIKLDQFVDLKTGKLLEHPSFQSEGL